MSPKEAAFYFLYHLPGNRGLKWKLEVISKMIIEDTTWQLTFSAAVSFGSVGSISPKPASFMPSRSASSKRFELQMLVGVLRFTGICAQLERHSSLRGLWSFVCLCVHSCFCVRWIQLHVDHHENKPSLKNKLASKGGRRRLSQILLHLWLFMNALMPSCPILPMP